MFRNEAQMCEALRLLLKPVRLDRLWNEDGPTSDAVQRREVGGSPGERVMVRAAWDLWNGTGNVRLYEILTTLDSTNVQMLATLILAVDLGADFVDLWISRQRRDQTDSRPLEVANMAMSTQGDAVRQLLVARVERDRLREQLEQVEALAEDLGFDALPDSPNGRAATQLREILGIKEHAQG